MAALPLHAASSCQCESIFNLISTISVGILTLSINLKYTFENIRYLSYRLSPLAPALYSSAVFLEFVCYLTRGVFNAFASIFRCTHFLSCFISLFIGVMCGCYSQSNRIRCESKNCHSTLLMSALTPQRGALRASQYGKSISFRMHIHDSFHQFSNVFI